MVNRAFLRFPYFRPVEEVAYEPPNRMNDLTSCYQYTFPIKSVNLLLQGTLTRPKTRLRFPRRPVQPRQPLGQIPLGGGRLKQLPVKRLGGCLARTGAD